jgi:hypothetical protein
MFRIFIFKQGGIMEIRIHNLRIEFLRWKHPEWNMVDPKWVVSPKNQDTLDYITWLEDKLLNT